MEYQKGDIRQQVAGRVASGDDAARFLRELRQLRDGAGLERAELAARAHYPYDSIMAAEAGPALPDLPVLSAYVRACGGTTEEWEERWRSLTRSPSLPVAAARHAGSSDAATAGARIGSVSQVVDSPDPSVIIAALNRVAEEMASPSADAVPTSPAVPSLPDFASDAAFPTGAEPFPSLPEPKTGDKPAGWDPIRVSSAWPTIRDMPTAAAAAAPTSTTGLSNGAGTPWELAASGKDPLAAASSATGPVGSGGIGKAPITGTGQSSSRTRAVVLAAVLLCVLAVLLAIFA